MSFELTNNVSRRANLVLAAWERRDIRAVRHERQSGSGSWNQYSSFEEERREVLDEVTQDLASQLAPSVMRSPERIAACVALLRHLALSPK